MPYARNSDLPPEVRDRYSDRCQTVFRHTFNEWDGDEESKFKVAHTAAGNCQRSTSKRSPLAMTDMTVKFAEGSDDIIEGYGVPFGLDLDGQKFTAKTERCHDWFPNGGRPILVDHGFDKAIKFTAVGRELSTEPTEEGDWVRAQLDKASKYYERVAELVRQGKVGWSSAAPDHKVKIAKDGTIERWPVIEYSLTTTPAKPNKVAFAMKSAQVIEALESNETEIPEPLRATEGIEQTANSLTTNGSYITVTDGTGSGSLKITTDGDSEPESLADHSERVLAGMKAWVERMEERSDFRMKVGRELSAANIAALREAHKLIGALLERADSQAKADEDASKAFADWVQLEAELAGVTSP